MSTNNLTREQAIAEVGIAAVEAVERVNCDFTNRVTNDGTVEFSASAGAVDAEGNDVRLTAYYYQDEDELAGVEELDQLDWEISHYTIV